MKRLVLAIVLALGVMAFTATPALAQQDTCPGEKYDVSELPVTTEDGIVITLSGDGSSVTFDLPEGMASAEVCVKAGSDQSGGGMTTVTVTDGESVAGPGGHDVSHVSIISVTATPPPGPQPPGPQPPGPQPPGPQPPGPQPPTPQPPGGGAGGTPPPPGAPLAPPPAAPAPSGEALPFTGLPVWIPLLAGAALLGSGLVLMRRRRDAES